MKSSVKWLAIILVIIVVVGSVSGTLVYFFVVRERTTFTFECEGYVRITETNQIVSNTTVELYALDETQQYTQIMATKSNDLGFYSIKRTFYENTTLVQQASFKLLAYINEELFDYKLIESFGNYTHNFYLSTPISLESEGTSFPNREDSHLTYSLFSVHSLETILPELTFNIGVDASSTATLRIYDNNQEIHNISLANNDTYTVLLPSLKKFGTHSIKFKIIPFDSNRVWVLEQIELENLFWNQEIKKIAYFFSPVIWLDFTPRIEVLEDHGFSVSHFKNPLEWEPIIKQLDEEEDENSIVLLFLSGHGNYIPYAENDTGDSYVTVNADTTLKIYSSELREKILNFESKRIMIIVEACYSGGFIDDLSFDGINIITGSDDEHTTNTSFGSYFFEGVDEQDMDDMDAFDYACLFFDGYINQIANPQAYWGSWHSFFAP